MNNIDMKPVVKNSYLQLIKYCINMVNSMQHDKLLESMLRLYIEGDVEGDVESDVCKKIVIIEKFSLYKKFWKAIMETLYENHLPQINYRFHWEIEITPYTVSLCEVSKNIHSNDEYEIQAELYKLTDEQLKSNWDATNKKMKLDQKWFDEIPKSIMPSNKKEQLILLFRLMNFPPLEEISYFVHRLNLSLKPLTDIFPNHVVVGKPVFAVDGALHNSRFHVSHDIFKKYGLETFELIPELIDYKKEFSLIRELAHKHIIEDNYICPCCGILQKTKFPEEINQYIFLIENRTLSRKIGLLYISEHIENIKKTLLDLIKTTKEDFNKVEHSDCIILVEGESEEVAVPVLSFKMNFLLQEHNIQVWNSGSKQKMVLDFHKLKKHNPKLKMIFLLDSDAEKEKQNILRIIKDQKNKYHLVFIEKGEFEDIFELEESIKVLNMLYREGEPILKSDFSPDKGFINNVNLILHRKKKTKFDKVKFAQTMSYMLKVDKIPEEIKEVIEVAKKFATKSKFIESS